MTLINKWKTVARRNEMRNEERRTVSLVIMSRGSDTDSSIHSNKERGADLWEGTREVRKSKRKGVWGPSVCLWRVSKMLKRAKESPARCRDRAHRRSLGADLDYS
jgi:hypothetical protein